MTYDKIKNNWLMDWNLTVTGAVKFRSFAIPTLKWVNLYQLDHFTLKWIFELQCICIWSNHINWMQCMESQYYECWWPRVLNTKPSSATMLTNMKQADHWRVPHPMNKFQEHLLFPWSPNGQMIMMLQAYRPRWFQRTWFGVNQPIGCWVPSSSARFQEPLLCPWTRPLCLHGH